MDFSLAECIVVTFFSTSPTVGFEGNSMYLTCSKLLELDSPSSFEAGAFAISFSPLARETVFLIDLPFRDALDLPVTVELALEIEEDTFPPVLFAVAVAPLLTNRPASLRWSTIGFGAFAFIELSTFVLEIPKVGTLYCFR